jgi:2-hydroxy-6-oxonona-2,4-dienedioate hydrolase
MIEKRRQNTENIERIETSVEGLRLNAFASGDSAGKVPVILVQGLGIAASYMIPAMSEMAQQTKVFALDLPGFGDSVKPAHIFNIVELADVLAAWMKVSDIERAVLVGHSFGSQIVAEFALRHSAMIDRAVFAAPTFDRRARSAFRQFGRLLLDARNEPLPLILLAVKSLFKFGLKREARTLQFALADRIEDKFPQIRVSSLVLRGEFDTVVPHIWAKELADLLPDGRFSTIEGGTHGVNYHSPQKFAETIRQFLDS